MRIAMLIVGLLGLAVLSLVAFHDIGDGRPCCGSLRAAAGQAAPRVVEDSARKPGCRCVCTCCGACRSKGSKEIECACAVENKQPCDCCNSCPGHRKPKGE